MCFEDHDVRPFASVFAHSLMWMITLHSVFSLPDRSFDDDDSVDGSRSSSAQAAFKVPKVPKKPAESSAARRPSATGGKLGT